MEPITLLDAARQVLIYMAPLIAGGALAKIGEDLTDTSLHLLDRAWSLVQGRLAEHPKASIKLAAYKADPEDAQQRQVVEGEVVRIFETDPVASQELIALAREIVALQPRTQQQGSRSVTATGNARIGLINQGDVAGDFHAGPIDMRSKTFLGVGNRQAAPVPSAQPTTEPVALPETLSADGVHFTYGHALIIGISSYKNPNYTVRNNTTTNDARALANLLRDPQRAAYPDDQVQVLLDAKATRARILDELEALAHRLASAPGSTALIFFAGHGWQAGGSYALHPYDGEVANLATTGITAELFHKAIAKIRTHARRLVVVLNCCHAGGVGDDVLGAEAGETAPPPDFYRPLVAGSGQVVISSSRPGQKSGARSRTNPQHTTFGAYLLTGLAGGAPGDGRGIGVFELFSYLRITVPADARKLTYLNQPLVQEPLFYASQLDDNIAVALRPAASAGTLGSDESAITRLIELELAIEAADGVAAPDLLAERDAILTRLTQTAG
jgi:hypothetical protein